MTQSRTSTRATTQEVTQAIRCRCCGKVLAIMQGSSYTSKHERRIITFAAGTIKCERCGTVFDTTQNPPEG